jgi:hypothetical protein
MDKQTKRLLWFIALVIVIMILIGLGVTEIIKHIDFTPVRRLT